MKVIFSRVYIEKANDGNVIQDRTSLLAWFLSVLKWNEFGYDTILYTDETTKTEFENLGLAKHFSEVKLIDMDESINPEVFWAYAKIASIKQFMKEYPNEEFMVSDLDFIPLADPKTFKQNDNQFICFYKEFVEAYCPINYLHFDKSYKLPDWFKGMTKPVNTCVMYIHDGIRNLFNSYLDMEIDFMKKNYDFESGQISNDLMLFIEQRLFAEYLVYNQIEIVEITPYGKSVFNVNGLHTGPYKTLEKAEYWKWIIWYLKVLKEQYVSVYNDVINLDLYSDFKTIIDNGCGTYKNKVDKEVEIKDFYWNKLDYPKAFEDIYDVVWNS